MISYHTLCIQSLKFRHFVDPEKLHWQKLHYSSATKLPTQLVQFEFTKYIRKKIEMHTWGRSKNKCFELFSTGDWAHSLQRGCFKSTALMSLPHRSHWSPRASSYAHNGQIPSTNRSARNLIHNTERFSHIYTSTKLITVVVVVSGMQLCITPANNRTWNKQ